MMTRLSLTIFVALFGVQLLHTGLSAKPMDTKASEKLSLLRPITDTIKTGRPISEGEVQVLHDCLLSEDPVLIAVAAWCVREMGSQGDILQADLDKVSSHVEDMTRAYVTLAKEQRRLREASTAQRVQRLTDLAQQSNPYVRLESAKMLSRLDRKAAVAIMDHLSRNGSDPTSGEATRALRSMKQAEATPRPKPTSNERYALVLSLTEE